MTRPDLQGPFQATCIINAALIVSILSYIGLGFFLKSNGTVPLFNEGDTTLSPDLLRIVLAALSAIQVGLLPLVRKLSLASQGTPGQRLQRAHIIVAALCEAIGVYGLLLFMLAGKSFDLLAFCGVSVLLLAIHFPRMSTWEQRLRHEMNASP